MDPNNIANNMEYLHQTQMMANPSGTATPQPAPTQTNNKTIIGLLAGAAVVVVIIIIMFVSSMSGGTNYTATYESAQKLQEELNSFTYNGNCAKVKSEAYNRNSVSDRTFNKHIEKCREEANALYDSLDAFGADKAITEDAEMSKIFAEFMEVFESDAPGRDQLESSLEAYQTLRSFTTAINGTDFSNASSMPSLEQFSNTTKILSESNNDKLKEIGDNLNQRYTTLYAAQQQYQQASDNYSKATTTAERQNASTAYNNARSAYNDAYNNFNQYFQKVTSNLDELGIYLAYTGEYPEDGILGIFNELLTALSTKVQI